MEKLKANKIITGDCAEVMASFPTECIDLTVTSPPYDNLRDYEGYDFDFEAIAAQLWRITKQGGVVVWVVGDATIKGSETLTSFRQALYFRELGFNVETMIYQQAGTGAKGSNYYYWQSFDYMFVMAKGQPKTSNRIADVKNSVGGKKIGTGKKAHDINSRTKRAGIVSPEYSVRPNIWRYHTGSNDKTDHPAPFPEDLARDHILSWSNAGDLALDPMCGSGTTLKMAKQTGRNFIGIDTSEKYVKIAEKRIASTNVPLFV